MTLLVNLIFRRLEKFDISGKGGGHIYDGAYIRDFHFATYLGDVYLGGEPINGILLYF